MIILYPILVVGGLGLAFGLILAFASKKFYVEVDPKIEKINDILPGANCAACGKAGCAGYAEAIVEEGMDITLCAPGGADTVAKIAEIMGMKASAAERKIAVIHCQSGGKDNTKFSHEYEGVKTCQAAVMVANGPNSCSFGCVYQNDCIVSCKFDAIKLDENGMRIIDEEKCTGCGACVKACPRKLIDLVEISKKVHIMCMSHDRGPIAKNACGNKTACIGCTLCVKKCPVDAITMDNNLAIIDYSKCISCGLCAKACPTKAIEDRFVGERKKAFVLEENCVGCTICKRKCPVDAIEGEVKQKHVVITEKCIGCEVCVKACPKKTMEMR